MAATLVPDTVRPETDSCQISNLLCLIAKQDRVAFGELYRITSGRMMGVMLRMLGSRAGAEDALQEVYLRIWLRAHSYDNARGNGEAWIFSIARYHAIDLLRQFSPLTDDIELDGLTAAGIDIEQRLTARAHSRQIVECLRMLDPEQSQALQAAYLNGQSYADLARHYQVPLNTIRTRLRRSLQQLRRCMQGQTEPLPKEDAYSVKSNA